MPPDRLWHALLNLLVRVDLHRRPQGCNVKHKRKRRPHFRLQSWEPCRLHGLSNLRRPVEDWSIILVSQKSVNHQPVDLWWYVIPNRSTGHCWCKPDSERPSEFCVFFYMFFRFPSVTPCKNSTFWSPGLHVLAARARVWKGWSAASGPAGERWSTSANDEWGVLPWKGKTMVKGRWWKMVSKRNALPCQVVVSKGRVFA